MGLPVACETDILGAITSLLVQAADLNRQCTFFADVTIRHPSNDNAELLWHCGPFPYALKAEDEKGFVSEIGKGQWRIKDGDITVCRFDGVDDKYKLLVGQGKSCEGPKTESTYVWFETDNWDRWEEKLIFGPYIHHVTGIFGKYGRVLAEASKYMPGIELDAMEDYPQSLGI
jgi:L-fucose isomerase-like protein